MPELLQTKLHVPPLRRSVLPRPRLSALADRSREVALTLVSAPAGFGKTTLLSEWASGGTPGDRPTAWLSLDARDNDPVSFWAYVLGALQAVAPELGTGAQVLLRSPHTDLHAGLEQGDDLAGSLLRARRAAEGDPVREATAASFVGLGV